MNLEATVADPWCTATRHGTRSDYTAGCRCETARKAAAQYQVLRHLDQMHGKPRLVDATGSLRRLQALISMGWTHSEIGEAGGFNPWMIGHWLAGRYGSKGLYRKTAERIALAYDRLSMQLPPEDTPIQRRDRIRSRNRAAELGWAPPLAWDDETIDDPRARPRYGSKTRSGGYDEAVVDRLVMEGVRVRHLRGDEAAEAVRRLRARGVTEWQLEHWYGFQTGRYPREAS